MKEKEIIKHLLKFQKQLRHYADYLTCDREQAKDLLQDTNLKTLEHLEKFEYNTNFQAWVFTIMHHLFINNWKKYSRIVFAPDIDEVRKNQSDDAGYDPVAVYELRELIESRLTLLSPEERNLWNLYSAGYRYEEIAEEIKIPLGTVKSRIHSVRKKLRVSKKELTF